DPLRSGRGDAGQESRDRLLSAMDRIGNLQHSIFGKHRRHLVDFPAIASAVVNALKMPNLGARLCLLGLGHDASCQWPVSERCHPPAAVMPPSTGMVAPVTQDAAGEARKAMTDPASWIVAIRPSGT